MEVKILKNKVLINELKERLNNKQVYRRELLELAGINWCLECGYSYGKIGKDGYCLDCETEWKKLNKILRQGLKEVNINGEKLFIDKENNLVNIDK